MKKVGIVMGYGFIKKFKDIYDIRFHKEEILNLEGFGEKSFNNLLESIEESRKTNPARLLYALGITGIGVTTANLIARHCKNSWNRIISLDEEELLQIEGIGSVTARDYIKFFGSKKNSENLRELVSCLNIDESFEETGEQLKGKTFVITGELEHFNNRKELKSQIESAGGKVSSSVSGNTDYLITNNPKSGSSKNLAAGKYGVEIIDEEKIMEMLSAL